MSRPTDGGGAHGSSFIDSKAIDQSPRFGIPHTQDRLLLINERNVGAGFWGKRAAPMKNVPIAYCAELAFRTDVN